MNLKDFIDAIEKAASKYFYKLRILVITDNAVKTVSPNQNENLDSPLS